MLRLIHFSDFHNQGDAIKNAVKLANKHPDWDVVAMTGDCTTRDQPYADERLNTLPQSNLFCVPGNHFTAANGRDGETVNEYRHLTNWKTVWPRRYFVKGSWFLCLDSNNIENRNPVIDQLARSWDNPPLFVIMMHEPPSKPLLLDVLTKIFDVRRRRKPKVLILHGHNHPDSPLWTENLDIGNNWQVCMSLVCSSPTATTKGVANLITLDDQGLHQQFMSLDHHE